MNRGKHPYPAFVRASETEQWKPSKSETGTAAGGFQGVTMPAKVIMWLITRA